MSYEVDYADDINADSLDFQGRYEDYVEAYDQAKATAGHHKLVILYEQVDYLFTEKAVWKNGLVSYPTEEPS